MRYLLIFIGAAVVAYVLAVGIRSVMTGRRAKENVGDAPPEAKRPPYRIR